jgi:hypothetical protein
LAHGDHPRADARLHCAQWQSEALRELAVRISLEKCRLNELPLIRWHAGQPIGQRLAPLSI